MHAAINVLCGVVYNLMRQSVVGEERVAVECSASSDMLVYLLLQYTLAATRHDRSANLSAPLQHAHDGSLVLSSRFQ